MAFELQSQLVRGFLDKLLLFGKVLLAVLQGIFSACCAQAPSCFMGGLADSTSRLVEGLPAPDVARQYARACLLAPACCARSAPELFQSKWLLAVQAGKSNRAALIPTALTARLSQAVCWCSRRTSTPRGGALLPGASSCWQVLSPLKSVEASDCLTTPESRSCCRRVLSPHRHPRRRSAQPSNNIS